MTAITDSLRQQVDNACRRLLNEQDRDPYTPTFGCFDRRYWGWKLTDYADATLQRNVYSLAWQLTHGSGQFESGREELCRSVRAGLEFAARIQHRDGSFDQAFPNEHSFGATAFLLQPLLVAYRTVRECCPSEVQQTLDVSLRRAADFLCRHSETHGVISNHLAGAALALLECAQQFRDIAYEHHALGLVEGILDRQSIEGWFPEYEGADPGYQTLCLHYLAQLYRLRPSDRLRDALGRAVAFLAWFVHPDGSFGGEYGSRRTAIYYPGGLALLSREFPMAWSMTRFMLDSIAKGRTVSLTDVDMGNVAPLLASYLTVLQADLPGEIDSLLLPWQRGAVSQDLPEAGLYVRGTRRYYAILGASNGGVLRLFDCSSESAVWNDGGYVGLVSNGHHISTQVTDLTRETRVAPEAIELTAPFYYMLQSIPSPTSFFLLRLMNLTVMRSLPLRNVVKALLVRLLVTGKRRFPLQLVRRVEFEPDRVLVADHLTSNGHLSLRWLECGRPFVGIHMASARYFGGFTASRILDSPSKIDVEKLMAAGVLENRIVL